MSIQEEPTMTTLATIETRADELNKEILPELSVAAEIVVRDAESYQMAGETWKSLTALEKKIKRIGKKMFPPPLNSPLFGGKA
jgi:hypothetical protein